MTVTLTTLCHRTGLVPLDHLDFDLEIPVFAGLQAQGDLIVIPLDLLDGAVQPSGRPGWTEVPPDGVELLRGADGGNPHTLVADPRTCRWTRWVSDDTGLALGAFECTAPVYLLHPEHGASGVAPGSYAVRRQREREGSRSRLVHD